MLLIIREFVAPGKGGFRWQLFVLLRGSLFDQTPALRFHANSEITSPVLKFAVTVVVKIVMRIQSMIVTIIVPVEIGWGEVEIVVVAHFLVGDHLAVTNGLLFGKFSVPLRVLPGPAILGEASCE